MGFEIRVWGLGLGLGLGIGDKYEDDQGLTWSRLGEGTLRNKLLIFFLIFDLFLVCCYLYICRVRRDIVYCLTLTFCVRKYKTRI